MWNALTCNSREMWREGCLCCYLLHHSEKNFIYLHIKNSCNTHAVLKMKKKTTGKSEYYKIYICPYTNIDMYSIHFLIFIDGEKKKKFNICIWTTTLNQRDWIDNWTNVCERDTNFGREMPTNIFFSQKIVYVQQVHAVRETSTSSACTHIINFVYKPSWPPATHQFAKHFLLRGYPTRPPQFDFLHGPSNSRLCVKK